MKGGCVFRLFSCLLVIDTLVISKRDYQRLACSNISNIQIDMQMCRFSYRICFLLFMIAIGTLRFHRFAEGLQRRIHVSDDLNGEEGEELKQWGEKKTANSDSESEPPANDVEKMSPSDIQSEMMKRVLGPLFGFVKLRLGTRRTPVSLFTFQCFVSIHALITD